MNNTVCIAKMDLESHHEKKTHEIARVYKEVFGSEPWNEGYKCQECVNDNSYPLSFSEKFCPKCSLVGKKVKLSEYWPIPHIIADFKKEMSKVGAVCYLAHERDSVIGFAWGYEILVDESVNEYLEAPGLHSIISQDKYLYLDEVAVLPKYRGSGIGKMLVKSICDGSDLKPILLRTKNNSPAFRMFSGFGGKVVLEITRERVIMTIVSQV